MRYTSLLALCAAFATAAHSQSALVQITEPSNRTAELPPVSTSPRFLLNGTELPDLPIISLVPLGPYAVLSKSDFVTVDLSGKLVNLNADNYNELQDYQFTYISCDPEAYPGYLNASAVLNNVLYAGYEHVVVILYSEYSNHCNATNLDDGPGINGVLTTINPMAATALANLHLNRNSSGSALILPDLNSYTNSSGNSGYSPNSDNLLGPSPTTAVAMIILYSITGIITALFIIIIITGAIRAHRHPERYGPRTVAGRLRQSRAKGIARAMLETLPIVKFGDHNDLPVKPAGEIPTEEGGRDIEMNSNTTTTAPTTTTASDNAVLATAAATTEHTGTTDEDNSLSCSICTEDFAKGEEVRVLPCNHKFHPDCVDPWLLNVSGTCPLCRIDLRPEEEREQPSAQAGEGTLNLPPPLVSGERRGTVMGLMGLRGTALSTREERIAALRRYRQERRRNMSFTPAAAEGNPEVQAERRGLSARLRDRFRIRTAPVAR